VIIIGHAHEVSHEKSILRVFYANKGEGLPRHEHTFEHLTMCHAGSCVLRKENMEKIITKKTQPINLKANEWHEIEALEDGTVFVNVFAEGKY
jgi:quercetin dioxygenase-like cupin family protein